MRGCKCVRGKLGLAHDMDTQLPVGDNYMYIYIYICIYLYDIEI
jgi:hypothetical protein